jgi:hypothetical protein
LLAQEANKHRRIKDADASAPWQTQRGRPQAGTHGALSVLGFVLSGVAATVIVIA